MICCVVLFVVGLNVWMLMLEVCRCWVIFRVGELWVLLELGLNVSLRIVI